MMNTVEVSHITKTFGDTRAVDDLTFAVERGEIFGLLGPNGAGKTTAIRILLDIFKPDGGSVAILGGPMTEAKKNHIGYMPEERGLYQDSVLEGCLVYLGTLKGLSAAEARKRVAVQLERFELAEHKSKKVKELSKGMQQKAQLIATLVHQPELLIIDEPFTALDPINTQMIKDLMHDLRRDGVTILMSTHQMHQVEELCDRILLIDHGRKLLYGSLDDIRKQYSGHAVLVRPEGELPTLEGIEAITQVNSTVKMSLAAGISPQEILKALLAKKVILEKFEIAVPTLDEIFIRAVAEAAS
ncbi:MAG: ATP-binding cassette domain-containing protein [Anaerolineae bacterium]|nr:ATP-binding cassette domain-containing protein [Anaerolineae bacterium]